MRQIFFYTCAIALFLHTALAQQLIVGGQFVTTEFNGINLYGLGIYDSAGTGSWQTLGNGTTGVVEAIAISEGIGSTYVFVGGDFQIVGCAWDGGAPPTCLANTGVTVSLIAKYRMDDGNWADLDGGVSASTGLPLVQALFATTGFSNERLIFVGGQFDTAGSGENNTVDNFALWNDTSEQWVTVGLNATSEPLDDCIPLQILRLDNYIIILGRGGTNNFAPTCLFIYDMVYDSLINAYNSFQDLAGIVLSLGIDVGHHTVYAVGSFNSMSDNLNVTLAASQTEFPSTTNAWQAMPGLDFTSTTVGAIAVNSSSRIFIGGSGLSVNGSENAGMFDGHSFQPLGPSGITNGPNDPTVSAIAIVGANVFYAGQFISAGNDTMANIAIWNADTQTWSSPANGGLSDAVNAMAVIYPPPTTTTATTSSSSTATTSATTGGKTTTGTTASSTSSSSTSSSSSSSTTSSSSSSKGASSSTTGKKKSKGSSSKKLSGGAVAGIVIGVLAGVGLIAGGVAFYYFKVRKSAAERERQGLVGHSPYGAL